MSGDHQGNIVLIPDVNQPSPENLCLGVYEAVSVRFQLEVDYTLNLT